MSKFAPKALGLLWILLAFAVIATAFVGEAGCVDGLAPDIDRDWDDISEVASESQLELIGISGRTLDDGESYRVPLDSERLVKPETTTREAMVLVNRSREDVLIEGFAIVCDSDEWRLVAPTRARELPLAVNGIMLHPDARIDFDIALTPQKSGLREAWLELSARGDGGADKRRIRLSAKVASGPSATGPGPPP